MLILPHNLKQLEFYQAQTRQCNISFPIKTAIHDIKATLLEVAPAPALACWNGVLLLSSLPPV